MQTLHSIVLATLLAFGCFGQAFARDFPQAAQRGQLEAYSYPSMKIGTRVYRLAAGSRIFNQQNLIIMPASLELQSAPVMYQLDTSGDLARVWLLTQDEALQHPLPK